MTASKSPVRGSDVQNVLDRASRIDEFMRRNPLDRRAQSDWSRMRGNLDRLASAYGVRWRWQQAYLPLKHSRVLIA